MIHPDEALKLIKSIFFKRQTECVPLRLALNRYLPESIIANDYSPPFDKSAMDGFAINHEDKSEIYNIIETIPAGIIPQKEIIKGTCSRIMTGAMLPKGATKVIKVENTKVEGDIMKIIEYEPNNNVIYKGENHKPKDILLTPTYLTPQKIGILASAGIDKVYVTKKPVVGIIATGSELREPGDVPLHGSIFNSNSIQLQSQLDLISISSIYYGIASDEISYTEKLIEKAITECDLIILTGGISMGDFDYVPDILKKIGFNFLFKSMAIKPGKPTLFAYSFDKFVFGLPGNPVSAFVIFELFVKPFIMHIMGLDYQPLIVKAINNQIIKRTDTTRVEYRPVVYKDGLIFTTLYHGSAHLDVFADANALIRFEIGEAEIPKGVSVNVRLI